MLRNAMTEFFFLEDKFFAVGKVMALKFTKQ